KSQEAGSSLTKSVLVCLEYKLVTYNRRIGSDMIKKWAVPVVGIASATATGLVHASATPGAQDAAAAPPALEALVAEALEKSAELRALEERIRAAEASVAPAGALPDPTASVVISNVPVGGMELDRTPMSGVELGLSQGVPAGRKRWLRREVRREEVELLMARYEDRRSNVIRKVKRAYYDLQYLDGALVIAEENKGLAEDLLATAEARYATGRGLQQDVFRAQVRLSRMIDALVALRGKRAAAAARLNRLLYRPPEQAVPKLAALARTTVALKAHELAREAEARNPRLREAVKRVEQSATKRHLAAAGIRPDLNLGLRYRIREDVPMDPVRGTDFWSASAGVTLPWVYRRDKVDQEVKAAEAQQQAAEQDLKALRNEILSRVEELTIEIERAEEQIALVETGLLPQAEGALASSRAAYATGQVEFLTLLDNQMNLYNLELHRLALIADRERNLAELDYLVGGALAPASADSEVKPSVE
ncbi:MAG: TolC family protein, partial [Armatimonadota bacterium]